jgi:hypothetical protein
MRRSTSAGGARARVGLTHDAITIRVKAVGIGARSSVGEEERLGASLSGEVATVAVSCSGWRGTAEPQEQRCQNHEDQGVGESAHTGMLMGSFPVHPSDLDVGERAVDSDVLRGSSRIAAS